MSGSEATQHSGAGQTRAPVHGFYRFHLPHAHLASVFGDDWFALKAEGFARFFGTPKFLIGQTVIVAIWMLINVVGWWVFDQYPFILLNLAFSLQAAYAAPLILLAQTRQADRDKATAVADAQHREDLHQVSEERQRVAAEQSSTSGAYAGAEHAADRSGQCHGQAHRDSDRRTAQAHPRGTARALAQSVSSRQQMTLGDHIMATVCLGRRQRPRSNRGQFSSQPSVRARDNREPPLARGPRERTVGLDCLGVGVGRQAWTASVGAGHSHAVSATRCALRRHRATWRRLGGAWPRGR